MKMRKALHLAMTEGKRVRPACWIKDLNCIDTNPKYWHYIESTPEELLGLWEVVERRTY